MGRRPRHWPRARLPPAHTARVLRGQANCEDCLRGRRDSGADGGGYRLVLGQILALEPCAGPGGSDLGARAPRRRLPRHLPAGLLPRAQQASRLRLCGGDTGRRPLHVGPGPGRAAAPPGAGHPGAQARGGPLGRVAAGERARGDGGAGAGLPCTLRAERAASGGGRRDRRQRGEHHRALLRHLQPLQAGKAPRAPRVAAAPWRALAAARGRLLPLLRPDDARGPLHLWRRARPR
mmetsp:Transcript_22600/g.64128  ORF Transcript_22600/g.64128 Transcript_22600/m.64128 type:complete len:235 (+) Transcript_22600:285-989(+)